MTALAQPLDEVEHLGGLLDTEGRGGLVEDDELGSAPTSSGRSPRGADQPESEAIGMRTLGIRMDGVSGGSSRERR